MLVGKGLSIFHVKIEAGCPTHLSLGIWWLGLW